MTPTAMTTTSLTGTPTLTGAIPGWRSLLFIPANNAGFVAKAHTRGADAVILDLEDSVAPAQKASARAGLAAAAAQVAAQGTAVLVRVNADSLSADLIAAVNSAVSAIVLPKVAAAAAVLQAAAQLEVLEHLRGLAPGQIGLIAQIEDVAALPRLDDIAAASPRLWGMSLGSEDFSASAGMQPTAEALYGPNQQVVLACRRAGIRALGFPASIALFGDLAALATAVNRGAQMGFTGALCIHPAQVAVLNQAFTPDPDAVADARQLLAAFADASAAQCGVLAWHGKMVDLPVILRARDLVARAEALAASAVNRITAPPPENVPEP